MAFDESVSRRRLLAALGMLPAAALLRAQQLPTFSSDTKVVNLFANVRDKKGGIVRDLTKDDFLLDEEGVPQNIRYFSQESNLPLTLGLLVDTSGSQRRLIDEERTASRRFFEQVLREKDMAFLIHFDVEVELLQDLTSSRRKLEDALDELGAPRELRRNRQAGGQMPGGGWPGGWPPRGSGRFPGGGRHPGGGGRGRGGGGGGTALYDSVLLASDELMKKQTGRKALILLTDGVDFGSKVSLSTAIEAAQRADTLTYGILFSDPAAYGAIFGGGRGANGKKVLDQISSETGGRMFEVNQRQSLSQVYDAIEEDLRHQYSIGYTPENTVAGKSFRRIHLTTKRKNLIVQTRTGYYPA